MTDEYGTETQAWLEAALEWHIDRGSGDGVDEIVAELRRRLDAGLLDNTERVKWWSGLTCAEVEGCNSAERIDALIREAKIERTAGLASND